MTKVPVHIFRCVWATCIL